MSARHHLEPLPDLRYFRRSSPTGKRRAITDVTRPTRTFTLTDLPELHTFEAPAIPPDAPRPRAGIRSDDSGWSVAEIDLTRAVPSGAVSGVLDSTLLARIAWAASEALRAPRTLIADGQAVDLRLRAGAGPDRTVADAHRVDADRAVQLLAGSGRPGEPSSSAAFTITVTHSGEHGLVQCVPSADSTHGLILDIGAVRPEVRVDVRDNGDERWGVRRVALLTLRLTGQRDRPDTDIELAGLGRVATAVRTAITGLAREEHA